MQDYAERAAVNSTARLPRERRLGIVRHSAQTAKMNGINPQAYLADVLGRIADHPINKINALLPWLWTK